jgi:hypothetical protein
MQEFKQYNLDDLYKESILQYIVEQVFDEQEINPRVETMTVSLTKQEYKELIQEVAEIAPDFEQPLHFIVVDSVKVFLHTKIKRQLQA